MDPFLNDLLEKTNNEFQTSTKTEEEIKRLTLEENMTEVKRTVHILNRGQQIQKFSIYLNLHRIMLEPDAFNSILPLVAGEILNQSEEIQIQAAKSLIKLIQNKVHIPSNKPNEIFQITCSILKIWNQVVLDEWVHVFNEILKRVPYEAISRECESTILSLSEASQHSLSKYVAVRLIGFVAGNGIKNTSQLFDRARILCQDPDFEIRKALAEEVMLKICLNVGTELTESKYLEKIMELHYDSNMSIKLAAISSLVKALEILSYDFRKNRMVYVFLELMNSVNEEVMKKISFYIGEIIYKLEDVIPKNSNQMNQIQNIYRDWSMNRNPEIKRNVIYNLPYMLTLYDNKDHFLSLYLKILKDTSTTHAQTKMIGVSCFHEICKVFKSEDFPQSLRDMFETLMKEDNSEISEKLVLHLDELIPIFQNEKEEVKSGSLTEREEEKDRKDTTRDKIKEKYVKDLQKEDQNTSCLDQLLKLAEQLKTSCLWRHEIIFMNHINKCENYFELRELAYKYVNYLVERIVGGVKEVQTTAINSLICILKKNYIPKRTAEIMYQVVQSLTNASNHQKRITFLEFYDKFAENFSKRFFKTHNLTDPVMKMGEDKVPEVRKKFLEKCITIRRMLNQNEALLIVRLEDHAAKNRMDKNPRIANLAKETLKELKSLTQYYFSECDEEDRRKMAEEDRLLEKEQRELEETKRRHSEDIRRDKGDYLLPFSSLMNSAASKKGGKNTINFKPGPKPSSFNPSSNTVSMTPKTKILGAQLYSSGLSMAKTSSHPGTSTHVDEHESKGKDTLPKIVKPGVKLNGSAQAGVKKIDSPSTLSSGAKLSPIITGMESLSKSAVMMSNGPSASIFKNEPKIPSIKSGPAQDSLKHPTKDLVKVPKIIKKKI